MKKLFAAINISPIAALAATGLLCACGGGGAGDSENLQTAQAPSLPIYVLATTLNATDSSGNTWTATYSSTAGGTTTFNGQVAYETSTSYTVSREATVLDSESTTQYALMNLYSPLGLVIYFDSLPGRLSPGSVTSYDPLPSALTAGESGSLSSGTFGSCSCVGHSEQLGEATKCRPQGSRDRPQRVKSGPSGDRPSRLVAVRSSHQLVLMKMMKMNSQLMGGPNESSPRRDDRKVTVTAGRLGVLGSHPLLSADRGLDPRVERATQPNRVPDFAVRVYCMGFRSLDCPGLCG
jgi:hypothetical protein